METPIRYWQLSHWLVLTVIVNLHSEPGLTHPHPPLERLARYSGSY